MRIPEKQTILGNSDEVAAKLRDLLEESIKKIDYLIATSSTESLNDKRHLRNAVILDDLADKIFKIDGKVGIVFGREDYGLFNKEIALCDVMVRIPTNTPVM